MSKNFSGENFGSGLVAEMHTKNVGAGLAALDKLQRYDKEPEILDTLAVSSGADAIESELWEDASIVSTRQADANVAIASAYLTRINALPDRHRYNYAIEHSRDKLRSRLLDNVVRMDITPQNFGSYLDALEASLPDLDPFTDRKFFDALHSKHPEARNIEASEADKERYARFLKNPDVLERYGSRFVTPHDSLFVDTLAGLGIEDAEGTFEAHKRDRWLFANKTRDLFDTLSQMERLRPGAVALLHSFYGIRGFGRYPIASLVDQYDKHGKADRPYAILCTAISDNNGALANLPSGFEGSGTDLKEEYDLRAIEAATSIELGRRLISLDNLYGEQQKISFAFVAAHGQADAFWLRSQREVPRNLAALTIESKLKSKSGKSRAAELFVEEPVIVLNSCSTGQEGGIAQKISEDLKATVIAPVEPAFNEHTVYARDKEGKLKIEPYYMDVEGRLRKKYFPVWANLFKDGKRIDGQEYWDYFADLYGPVRAEKTA